MLRLLLALLAIAPLGAQGKTPGKVTAMDPWLHAGPIRVKFADGELRYLTVGDHEIVRRIYFAVRNGKWATAAPEFSTVEMTVTDDHFEIKLAADCLDEGVDYHWTGQIIGTADGRITFTATGKSGAAFRSNRLGLCVLYGAPALAGHAYATLKDGDAAANPGLFPPLVSPELVRGQFNTLVYTTGDGMTVRTTVAGTRFDMEDQRTYGDSSFKAYAPLTYAYPEIPANAEAHETVTVQVEHAPPPRKQSDHLTVTLGGLLPNAKVPTIETRDLSVAGGIFGDVNGQQAKFRGASALTWEFAPSIHLLDDDAFLENAWVLPDQVKTAHSYAPGATITIDPIVLNTRPGRAGDPRRAGAFGAAWSAIVVRQLALAGVGDAHFALGPGAGETLQKELARYAGHATYGVTVDGYEPGPSPVDALAIDDGGRVVVYLVNRTEGELRVRLAGAKGIPSREVRLGAYGVVQI